MCVFGRFSCSSVTTKEACELQSVTVNLKCVLVCACVHVRLHLYAFTVM